MEHLPTHFEHQAIRRAFDEGTETWWFSVVDIVQVLTRQPGFQTARKVWNHLRRRLSAEGSEAVTKCHRLKPPFGEGLSALMAVFKLEKLAGATACPSGCIVIIGHLYAFKGNL